MESQYYSLTNNTNANTLKDNLSQSGLKQTPVEDSSSFRTANYADAENFFQGNTSQLNSVVMENRKESLLSNKHRQSLNVKKESHLADDRKDTRTTSAHNETKYAAGTVSVNELGNKSMKVECPLCLYEAFTEIKYEMRKGAKCLFVFFVITLVLIPFAMIIYSMKSLKNVVHECPNCGNVIKKVKYDTNKK